MSKNTAFFLLAAGFISAFTFVNRRKYGFSNDIKLSESFKKDEILFRQKARKEYYKNTNLKQRVLDEKTTEPFIDDLEIYKRNIGKYDVKGIDNGVPKGLEVKLYLPNEDNFERQAKEFYRVKIRDNHGNKEIDIDDLSNIRKENSELYNKIFTMAVINAYGNRQELIGLKRKYKQQGENADISTSYAYEDITDKYSFEELPLGTKDGFLRNLKSNLKDNLISDRKIYADFDKEKKKEKKFVHDLIYENDYDYSGTVVLNKGSDQVGRIPFKINYYNKEIEIGNAYVKPEYRNKGFYPFLRRSLNNFADELKYDLLTEANDFELKQQNAEDGVRLKRNKQLRNSYESYSNPKNITTKKHPFEPVFYIKRSPNK